MICLAVPGLGAAAQCPGWSRTRGQGCASTVATHSQDGASLFSLYVRGRDLVTDGLFPWEGGLAGCLAGIWQLGLGVKKEMQGKVDDKKPLGAEAHILCRFKQSPCTVWEAFSLAGAADWVHCGVSEPFHLL